ncbi:hypothetical protein [Neisseria sp.]|uniref:hypothetical protein n=1 Tax=Neisseria sp. TaxID=192066 RepID=UPI0035A17E44
MIELQQNELVHIAGGVLGWDKGPEPAMFVNGKINPEWLAWANAVYPANLPTQTV